MRLRLDVHMEVAPVSVPAEVRRQLFLTVKESITNTLKNSEASEVWLRVTMEDGQLRVSKTMA